MRPHSSVLPSWAALAASTPIIDEGARVVFLGDSITQQGLYTAYAEDWLALRHPGRLLTCFNAGWAGDTVDGARLRFARDVAPLRPTVVSICLGMNDGGYAGPDSSRTARFACGLADLIGRVTALGAQPVLLTPGMSDDRKQPAWARIGYNQRTLRLLADVTLSVARRLHCPAVDLHALMNAVAARGRRQDPDFTLAPDGNHPDAGGHLVMAMGLLNALGERPARSMSIHGDAAIDHHLYPVPESASHVLPYLPALARPAEPVVRLPARPSGPVALHQPDGRVLPLESRALRRGLRLSAGAGFTTGADLIRSLGAAGRAAWANGWREIGLAGRWGFDGAMEAPCDAIALRSAARLVERASRLRRQIGPPTLCLPLIASPRPQPVHDAGFIHTWAVCGPCQIPFGADGLAGQGGEAAIALPGSGLHPLAWSRLLVRPGSEADCLGRRFGPRSACCAYLAVDLHSAQRQDVVLGLGSDDGFALWCNGRLLGRNLDLMRGSVPDSETFRTRLSAGINRLLLKVTQHAGGWGFHLRMSGQHALVTAHWPLA